MFRGGAADWAKPFTGETGGGHEEIWRRGMSKKSGHWVGVGV